MKQVFFIGLACMLALSVSCSRGTDQKRVVYITRTQGDSFAAWLANAMTEEAARYPDIKLTVVDGQANDEIINSAIENAIINKNDLIIVQPNDGNAQRQYVERVIQAGIPVILTNPRIDGLESSANSVDADPYEQGAVSARLALTEIPQNARVVVLNGPPGNIHALERRRAWQEEFFDKRSDVQIVGENIANWNKDEAMQLMEDWVQKSPQIDAVISANDNMAAGALEVVKSNPRYDNLLVYGVDGTAEAALLIKEGRMRSTSFQNAYELAQKNMELADKILKGETEGTVNIDIDCPLITQDNVQTLIDAHVKAGALQAGQ